MTIICINAVILYWVPNSSQVRASRTVLQIILKLMIKGYHQKLHIMCYNHLIYLYFHFSCGFTFTGAQVNLHWR